MIHDPFEQMTPCKSCPFRTDHPPSLRPGRTRQIEADLKADKQFVCHGKIRQKVNCAGSLLMMVQLGLSNNPMRMAERLRIFDPKKLNKRVKIYPSFDAMEAAMRGEEAKYDDQSRAEGARPKKSATPRKRR